MSVRASWDVGGSFVILIAFYPLIVGVRVIVTPECTQ